ncbi:MAG: rod shape-determining protein MreC, partial [Clostridia bacterium]|nr:rod shape-determining protein MreC [Clostridia bacterium]
MKKKFAKKHIIIYACITAFILVLTAFSYKTGNNAVSNVVGTVFSPIQRLSASGVRVTKNTWKNLTASGKNARENKKLREEVLELNKQLRILEGYKTENNKLREILDLKETRYEFDTIAANVIAKSNNEFQSTITIDKGSKDGVKKDSVVTVAEGLVGIVFETGYNYSKVKTVYDSESAVSGICLRTGDMGIVEPTRNMI